MTRTPPPEIANRPAGTKPASVSPTLCYPWLHIIISRRIPPYRQVAYRPSGRDREAQGYTERGRVQRPPDDIIEGTATATREYIRAALTTQPVIAIERMHKCGTQPLELNRIATLKESSSSNAPKLDEVNA
ncbi:hypothetical protein EVAR_54964_1 [Eumeta japonica]|uniref:Uncharacterized protein n=1 Tax=Eumeta variegata TaxID=151549 RepID=A0A4C1YPF8_EUMVA|nr:hypothetical protein EVAR_54964_1 [Eumeta japonica]